MPNNRDTCDYIPRFSFEISEELKSRCDKLLYAHGIRRALMTPILEDLLDMLEEHGMIVAGVIIDKSTKPRDIVPSMAEAERRAKK